jgi:DNA-binding transcriptional LysR family regulator
MTPEWKLRRQIRMSHLLLLQALDAQGSLRRAADSLAVSQPAATKLLAQLESLLGLPLFERSARGMKPTQYGRIMIRHAQAALGELSAAHESLLQSVQGAEGKIAIGAVVGSIRRLTAPTVAGLLAHHPKVAVSVLAETSATLVPLLLRRELDFVVGQVPPGIDAEALAFEALCAEPIEIAVRPGHPLLGKRRLALRGVADATWIVPPAGSPLRVRIDTAFRAAGLATPRRIVESASTLFAVTAARHSDMLAALPSDVAEHYRAAGFVDILPLRLRDDAGMLGIVSRLGERPSPAAALLVAALRERAVSLGARQSTV